MVLRCLIQAIALSIPILANVLSFMTYSLTGHNQNPAIIFTSLTLFSLLRMPLIVGISFFILLSDLAETIVPVTDAPRGPVCYDGCPKRLGTPSARIYR
jgi:hypothetical protein